MFVYFDIHEPDWSFETSSSFIFNSIRQCKYQEHSQTSDAGLHLSLLLSNTPLVFLIKQLFYFIFTHDKEKQ